MIQLLSFGQDDSMRVELDTARAIEAEFLNPLDSTTVDSTDISNVDEVNQNNADRFIFENENVIMYYNTDSINYEKHKLISNVLTVINKTDKKLKFFNNLNYPSAWKSLSFEEFDNYSLAASDSVRIPILLVPSKGLLGGTSITVTSILIDSAYKQIGDISFGIHTPKYVSWTSEITPESLIYLKNGENKTTFDYTLTNTGSNKQDFFVNFKSIKNDIILTDSADNILKPNHSFTLDKEKDTTIEVTMTAIRVGERNFNRLSTLNYIPNTDFHKRNYTLFIESTEPKSRSGNLRKGEKVDMIQLPNTIEVSEISNSTLPLTVIMNAQNLLADNSFLNLTMRGNKQINEQANLVYFTQLNYDEVYFATNVFTSTPWYVGYFDNRITGELGQVAGNIIGLSNAGKGAKGSYRYGSNMEHQSTGFYVRAPRLFGPTGYQTFGAMHSYIINDRYRVSGGIGRTENPAANFTTNAANVNGNFKFGNKHYTSVMFAGTNSQRTIQGTTITRNGFLVGASYSSNFFDHRLRVVANGRYNDRNFSAGAFDRTIANLVSSFKINDRWTVNMNNFYNNQNAWDILNDTIITSQSQFSNNAVFTTSNRFGSFQPGLFFNAQNIQVGRIHSRGLSFRYSKVVFDQNLLSSFFVRAGYNDALDLPELRNYFILESTGLFRYRVWTVTARYNYGANSPVLLNFLALTDKAPQTFRISLQNQYQFRNPHFVFETSTTYTYNNLLSSHTLNMFPELFYFSNTGWRFSVNANFGYNSSNFSSIYSALNEDPFSLQNAETNSSYSLVTGVSIKKDFKIPIPFITDNAVDVRFVAFYDMNGNGVKEENEPTIPNVIVNINDRSEVLTDEEGFAFGNNIPLGNHKVSLNALEELEGWFPNLPDSCDFNLNGDYFLPYVRGVKVYGDVALERQDIAVMDKDKQFDLSRIKITASNGKVYHTLTDVDGKFEFYMPNGNYIITLDENVLGNKYSISRNNIPLEVKADQTNVYVSFYIYEKKREVKVRNFGGDW